ncbi:transcription antitermination factor NusB [Clostridium sp. HCP1S3_B4]|uniref:transcription antitermination factor NusB n=1 Tax=unclassified Clostridium TaxID=2614128 RepID=UPI001691E185|nr:transcription antitermination factor NusB [Clostridiales bacterium]MDY2728573.1 transcription antitermination factor NusB [Clostridium sp.]NLK23115.1 transcription antitermination factor NusB [Clostridiales bacterium]
MSRKKSREKAMEILFGMTLSKDAPAEAIDIFKENNEDIIKDLDLSYINDVVFGVHNNLNDIDEAIKAALDKWKIDRISKVNLTILRLAVYEMKYVDDVPAKVAINEAIEIAKVYSDEKSVSFINGVLDKVLKNS